jgi:hypothetical protein
MAGPLEKGARVRLELSPTSAYEALVTFCGGGSVTLEPPGKLPLGALTEGTVVAMVNPLSWGMYKWLCVVAKGTETTIEVQFLDGPTFIPRRNDPRTNVDLPASVSLVFEDKKSTARRAVVTDISSGGLKLKGLSLRSGDAIEVTIDLPANASRPAATVSVLALVVMVYHDASVGSGAAGAHAHVQFIGGQDAEVAALDAFAAYQRERSGTA